MSSARALALHLRGHLVQPRLRLRHVQADHAGAFARHDFGNRGPDAARCTGHQHLLARQGLVPVGGRGAIAHRCPDADHLRRHIGRARRQQETQCGFDLGLGALGDIDQLHRDGLLELLGQRTRQPFQRALHGGLARVRAGLGRTADDDHAAAGQHRARRIVKEGVQGFGLRAVVHPGGVEHQGLDLFAGLAIDPPAAGHQAGLVGQRHPLRQLGVGHGLRAHRLEHRCEHVEHLRIAGATEQHRPLDHGLARLVTLQLQGFGQAEGVGQAGADGGVGKVKVGIGHGQVPVHRPSRCRVEPGVVFEGVQDRQDGRMLVFTRTLGHGRRPMPLKHTSGHAPLGRRY